MATLKRIEQIGSFPAITENGDRTTILAFQNIFDAATYSNPHAESRGLKFLETTDGLSVNRIDKGQYSIVGPFGDIRATSDSPDAL